MCQNRFVIIALTYQWSTQQLRAGPRSGVLLHIFDKPIAFGLATQLTVHQEEALDVSIQAHQLLKLLRGEGVGQVGEAKQGIGGLQGDVDQAPSDSAVVEGADGILSLVPVQQSHKGWRRAYYGDSDKGTGANTYTKRDAQTQTETKKHKHTFKAHVNKQIATVRMQDVKKHAQKHMEKSQ